MKINEIPLSAFQETQDVLLPYAVGLIGLSKSGNDQDLFVVGSGTLVSIGEKHGILTAAHVIDEKRSFQYKRAIEIGFNLMLKPHRFSIPKDALKAHMFTSDSRDQLRPDLGFLEIPNEFLGTILSHKSFWNITKNSRTLRKTKICVDTGIWGVIGCPDEKTTEVHSIPGFSRARGLELFAGFGLISDYRIDGDHDYYDFSVEYVTTGEAPLSYQGVSGGGLWQFDLAGKRDNQIRLINPRLKGVAFYQNEVTRGQRTLVCHGHKSIYETLEHDLSN